MTLSPKNFSRISEETFLRNSQGYLGENSAENFSKLMWTNSRKFLENFKGNIDKQVTKTEELGEIPHFSYLGNESVLHVMLDISKEITIVLITKYF